MYHAPECPCRARTHRRAIVPTEEAGCEATTRGEDAIFLMTDGQPTDASTSEILSRVHAMNANRRMVLHTIGLGPDQNEVFLAELARQNGGQYVKKE